MWLSYLLATQEMQSRLDYGSKTMAAQDFWHTRQGPSELVCDFIRRLENFFSRAYGKDRMSLETRATLLFGQLQEGLRDSLMRAPALACSIRCSELPRTVSVC